MEFRRRHGCLRNQAMRGLRISLSTPPDAAPSLSLRHGTGSSRVRMAFLYALLQSIGRPLQRRLQLASMSDMPHVSLPSRTTRLDRLEWRHDLRPSAPEQPWRPDVAVRLPYSQLGVKDYQTRGGSTLKNPAPESGFPRRLESDGSKQDKG